MLHAHNKLFNVLITLILQSIGWQKCFGEMIKPVLILNKNHKIAPSCHSCFNAIYSIHCILCIVVRMQWTGDLISKALCVNYIYKCPLTKYEINISKTYFQKIQTFLFGISQLFQKLSSSLLCLYLMIRRLLLGIHNFLMIKFEKAEIFQKSVIIGYTHFFDDQISKSWNIPKMDIIM